MALISIKKDIPMNVVGFQWLLLQCFDLSSKQCVGIQAKYVLLSKKSDLRNLYI